MFPTPRLKLPISSHGTALKWGLRIQNVLGVFKVAILILIAFSGFAALAGRVKIDPKPDNFTNSFEGTGSINANAFVTGLYNVIWSYIGALLSSV